jgi:hypothetical protein
VKSHESWIVGVAACPAMQSEPKRCGGGAISVSFFAAKTPRYRKYAPPLMRLRLWQLVRRRRIPFSPRQDREPSSNRIVSCRRVATLGHHAPVPVQSHEGPSRHTSGLVIRYDPRNEKGGSRRAAGVVRLTTRPTHSLHLVQLLRHDKLEESSRDRF